MSLWTAFDIGLRTALDPLHVTTVLCFFLMLCAWGRSWVELVTMGAAFMLMVFLGEVFFCFGLFDFYTTHIILNKVLKGFYLVFAVLFLGQGMAHLRDWMAYYRNPPGQTGSSSRVTQEAVFIKGLKPRPLSWITIFGKTIAALVLAVSLVFLSSLAPREEYMFVLFSSLMAGKETTFVFLSFVVYALAVCWPLLVTWLLILITARSLKVQRMLDRWYSLRIIVLAALFTGVGGGVAYSILGGLGA